MPRAVLDIDEPGTGTGEWLARSEILLDIASIEVRCNYSDVMLCRDGVKPIPNLLQTQIHVLDRTHRQPQVSLDDSYSAVSFNACGAR